MQATILMTLVLAMFSSLHATNAAPVSSNSICGWKPDGNYTWNEGITVKGLSTTMDGYWAQNNPPIQWNRDSTYNPPNSRPEVVLGRFDDNYNGGTFAGAGIPISDDDYKKYMEKWMVFSGQPDPRVASEVLAVCSAGCPDMPDQLYGDCHNTAVFPDDGSHHTTWHIIKENKDVQVAMTCTVPPPVPSCEKTCSQADCASVNQDECADEYKSTCCKPQRGGIGQPPICVCKEQSLAN